MRVDAGIAVGLNEHEELLFITPTLDQHHRCRSLIAMAARLPLTHRLANAV